LILAPHRLTAIINPNPNHNCKSNPNADPNPMCGRVVQKPRRANIYTTIIHYT